MNPTRPLHPAPPPTAARRRPRTLLALGLGILSLVAPALGALLGAAPAHAQTTLSGHYDNAPLDGYDATAAGSPYTVTATATFNHDTDYGLYADGAKVTVNGAQFIGSTFALGSEFGSDVTVNAGTFVGSSLSSEASALTINGGTYDGGTFANGLQADGSTVNVTGGSFQRYITTLEAQNGTDLTVSGGSFTTSSFQGLQVFDAAATVSGGSFDHNKLGLIVYNGGGPVNSTLTVTGGSVTNSSTYGLEAQSANSIATVAGGTFDNPTDLYATDGATLNVTGGTFGSDEFNDDYGVRLDGAKALISGGTFEVGGGVDARGTVLDPASVSISGGTFTGGAVLAGRGYATATITGGTFNTFNGVGAFDNSDVSVYGGVFNYLGDFPVDFQTEQDGQITLYGAFSLPAGTVLTGGSAGVFAGTLQNEDTSQLFDYSTLYGGRIVLEAGQPGGGGGTGGNGGGGTSAVPEPSPAASLGLGALGLLGLLARAARRRAGAA